MTQKESLSEKIVGAPAKVLEEVIEVGGKVGSSVPGMKKAKEYWHVLGPGLTTGAADDDPSGVATYSQTGALYGFQLLWLSIFTFPLMSVVQEMCARIGLVTGRGLAGNIRHHFSRKLLYVCTLFLFTANTFNIGANLGAMAEGTRLLFDDLPFPLLVVFFAIFSLGLQIFTPYAKYAKYLKYLAMVLFAYVASALLAGLDWGTVMKSAVTPSITFSRDQILMICAILGTTISPYLFFWQTSQEIEDQILDGRTTIKLREGATDKEIKNMRIDVWSGMALSNIVMFFIIAACAATIFASGNGAGITTSAQAAEALRPLAGDATFFLFAVGIIGTGMLSIPVLAGSSSYALAETFNWKMGLYRNLKDASGFYGVIIISMFVGLGLNFMGIDPIKALIWSAIANGLVSPIVLVFIVLLSSNRHIMGDRVNSRSTTVIGWFVVALMSIAGIAAIISLF